MITIYIKTWRCINCDHAYSGAIPPIKAQWQFLSEEWRKNKNLFMCPFDGLDDFECPKCHTPTLQKVTDPKKKTVHNHMEQSDIEALKTKLDSEPLRKIKVSNEPERLETIQEKTKRIADEIVKYKPVTPERLQQDRDYFEDK